MVGVRHLGVQAGSGVERHREGGGAGSRGTAPPNEPPRVVDWVRSHIVGSFRGKIPTKTIRALDNESSQNTHPVSDSPTRSRDS